MPVDEGGLTGAAEPPRVAARLRTFLLVALLAQAGILAYQHTVFFGQMFGRVSRAGATGAAPAGSSAVLALSLLAASALWALRPGPGSLTERLGRAGLVHLATLGLGLYAAGLLADGFVRVLAPPLLLVSALLAVLVPHRGTRASRPLIDPPPGPWDAGTVLALGTLGIPTVFPYIHFDAATIWACRALGFGPKVFFGALGDCLHPNYPPLFSLLLALGASDPLFEGRLLP
ncbi:MAG TPA: hypothetical protein VLH41_01970, partial [Thermoanaerobaculia bacterium]|nr:hypothetical protein [Thermoanaerobaculia bacterium]